MTYAPAKFEAAMSNGLEGNAFARNIWWSIAIFIMWPMYLQSLKLLRPWLRRCITKKIYYLTLTPRSRGSRSHKMLPSTLDFIWPMHQHSLMLLHPMVKERMHLWDNTLFELDPKVKFTQNVAQYPRQHVIYAPAKFDIATSYGKGEDAFTRNCIIWPWHSGQAHTKCCPVPSTSCDLCTYRVWSYFVKSFRRRSIYRKIQYLTFDLDLGVNVTWHVAQYHLHYVTYSATKFKVATSNRLGGDTFTRKKIIWSLTLTVTVSCCPVSSIQLQSLKLLRCYDIKPVKKEEGESYWKIPLCDDDATREK